MMIKTKPKTPEEFISSAKAEAVEDNMFVNRDKTFLLRMPIKLHEIAKDRAEVQRLSLHDFILIAIKEKATK